MTPDIKAYKRNPDPLTTEAATFISDGPDGLEAFRVSSFLNTGKTNIFYVVFTDQGNEALPFTEDIFFELLGSAQRVVM